MKATVRMKFGSHLYGTDTPASDLDYKGVFVPAAADILLQRVKGSISTKRPKAEREKNVAGEIDEESYSLQRYLALAAEGQTVALDMLFAPRSALEIWTLDWAWIQDNTHRLVTRKCASFIGYCRQQANKYGIKGSRVAAARAALELLSERMATRGTVAKLGEIEADIGALVLANEHMSAVDIEVPGRTVRHWDVCGRKMPFTSSIKTARDIMQRLVDEYGHRALQAERQQGVDWKALSHAVRVGRQAIELLGTGRIEFPLAYCGHLVSIKLGEQPYQCVAEEIERLLVEVEQAAAVSSLRDEPDYAWIDATVSEVYRREITAIGA